MFCSFKCSNSAGSNTVEYLVLAGGGGASGDRSGGGGVEDLEQITHQVHLLQEMAVFQFQHKHILLQ